MTAQGMSKIKKCEMHGCNNRAGNYIIKTSVPDELGYKEALAKKKPMSGGGYGRWNTKHTYKVCKSCREMLAGSLTGRSNKYKMLGDYEENKDELAEQIEVDVFSLDYRTKKAPAKILDKKKLNDVSTFLPPT